MILALKLLLAPLLVVLSSLAGRRWGPQLAGLLVALPVVAGPILLITELEHGREFAARAAGSALLGLVTLAAFSVIFAWVSPVLGWVGGLLVGWAAALRGGGPTVAVLRGVLQGLIGFATFCFLIAVLVTHASTGLAFVAAASGALLVQFSIRFSIRFVTQVSSRVRPPENETNYCSARI